MRRVKLELWQTGVKWDYKPVVQNLKEVVILPSLSAKYNKYIHIQFDSIVDIPSLQVFIPIVKRDFKFITSIHSTQYDYVSLF